MAWNYWNWVWCNIFISTAIVFNTFVILVFLLRYFDQLFYGIVAKLFNIERCFIDVHHNIISRNSKINISSARIIKATERLSKIVIFCKNLCNGERELNNDAEESTSDDDQPPNNNEVRPYSDKNDNLSATQRKVHNRVASYQNPSSHPEHEREILNIYGKYIPLNKFSNKLFITILTTAVISAAIMAVLNSLILTSTAVYRGGPCPNYGPMECFCGDNHTYFQCQTGANVTFPFDTLSGTCFRWIARDVTTSDVTTQIGVTAGLLTAFGSITQALIHLYLHVLQKRLGVRKGIFHMMAKTVGINGTTAPTLCCGSYLPCHYCSCIHLRQYKNPCITALLTIIYISVPGLIIPAIILLYYYELNVTSLTFAVLITFAFLCILAMLWMAMEDDELSANIPGGWKDIQKIRTELVDLIVAKKKKTLTTEATN
ncbi:unnamed protein product [Rotaria socialis]|uniref:Uncharacterized protein n=1 Tax=Rotaria socialis TaxID=392032 RepID=A0A819ALU3_9BILA|nr:unnamed protein product [Rotaria socialis]CAF3217193.1 unnamed protein product [Rotaria socialis]CAF3787405.1 unnamed protein product [Rotaria socialis]CAF4125916.1 unnamed protein product [Rotaria socialis]CAF4466652.1 unnamed protein product [Rotaria socialis]